MLFSDSITADIVPCVLGGILEVVFVLLMVSYMCSPAASLVPVARVPILFHFPGPILFQNSTVSSYCFITALPACRPQFEMYESQWKGLMAQQKFVDAFHIFDEMLNGDKIDYPTYYANVTGMGSNYFNFEQSPDGCEREGGGPALVFRTRACAWFSV